MPKVNTPGDLETLGWTLLGGRCIHHKRALNCLGAKGALFQAQRPGRAQKGLLVEIEIFRQTLQKSIREASRSPGNIVG